MMLPPSQYTPAEANSTSRMRTQKKTQNNKLSKIILWSCLFLEMLHDIPTVNLCSKHLWPWTNPDTQLQAALLSKCTALPGNELIHTSGTHWSLSSGRGRTSSAFDSRRSVPTHRNASTSPHPWERKKAGHSLGKDNGMPQQHHLCLVTDPTESPATTKSTFHTV